MIVSRLQISAVLLPRIIQQCYKVTSVTMANYSTTTLFTDAKQTECYAKFRPRYTDEVFQRIIEYCKEEGGACDFQLAVDVGCGSGQSTIPLVKHFKQVLGVDVSEQQIKNAPKDIPNLTFRVSSAEDLNFAEKESVDLVTMAQAFHWVIPDKFFAEMNRILKPGGSLVIYGYGNCHLEPKEADDILQHVYGEILGDYWPAGRRMVENHYVTVTLPYPGWYRDDNLVIEKECTIEEFVGYVGSWSALSKYREANPKESVLGDMQNRLKSVNLGSKGKLIASWPVFMLLGHKP